LTSISIEEESTTAAAEEGAGEEEEEAEEEGVAATSSVVVFGWTSIGVVDILEFKLLELRRNSVTTVYLYHSFKQ